MKIWNLKILENILECYLKSDITLLADVFNNFRKIIFDNLGLDPVKYISAPSLTKDCALKYSKAKIENIKMYQYFNLLEILLWEGYRIQFLLI